MSQETCASWTTEAAPGRSHPDEELPAAGGNSREEEKMLLPADELTLALPEAAVRCERSAMWAGGVSFVQVFGFSGSRQFNKIKSTFNTDEFIVAASLIST